MPEALLSFVDALRSHALSRQDADSAAKAAWACGRLLWSNQVGVYRDDVLEPALLSRWESAWPLSDKLPPCGGRILHVISTPYAAGGHTRLLEKLAAMSPEHSDVLVTRPFGHDGKVLRVPSSTRVICSEQGYGVVALAEMILGYGKVLLHIHPDDIDTSLAVGLARSRRPIRVIFVNHADHAFSFGFHSSDVVAEVSVFGFQLSAEKRRVSSSFLGIPVPSGANYEVCQPRAGALHLVSAGSSLKFRPAEDLSFPVLAMALLERFPDARMTIVGPNLRNNWWWYLPQLRYPRRLRLYPVLPYAEYLAVVRAASLYLDSLPMTGGTVLPEVRAQGIPVSGLMTGATGYTPLDATKYPDLSALLDGVAGLMVTGGGDLLARNNDAALLAASVSNHDGNAVWQRLMDILESGKLFAPIAAIGKVDTGFYERQWRQHGVAKIDREVIAYVLALPSEERAPLMMKMWRAMGWRQRCRLLFRRLAAALR
ncbi:MAG: hypothetical protein Q8J78_05815 [Moraxellaceae bacterium]|nr:hypothetical protein [Moraxellaceae bacterium]